MMSKYTKGKADTEKRHYLEVPFSEKDEAKELGARWDVLKKKWYATKDISNFDRWNPEQQKPSKISNSQFVSLDVAINEAVRIYKPKIQAIQREIDKVDPCFVYSFDNSYLFKRQY